MKSCRPVNIYLVTNEKFLYQGDYTFVSLREGINLIKDKPELGLDSETKGLDPYTKRLLLLQMGDEEIQVLFDINSFNGIIPEELKRFFNTYTGIFILQNAKFDLKFLMHHGIVITNLYDTFLAETIITNGLQYGGRALADLVDKYCNEYMDKDPRGDIITKGLTDRVIVYSARDVVYLSEIKRKQLIQIRDLNLQKAVDLDNSFVIVLAYIEYSGIKLDYEKWRIRTDKYRDKSLQLKQELEDILLKDNKLSYFSGMVDMFTQKRTCEINWDSPKQVIKLFKEYGIKTTVRIKGEEKESIDSKVLDPQKNDFEILPVYLEYKGVMKILSTYGYGWKGYINSKTGRIHTTFKQLMDTGRLSCGNKRDGTPNLQNIPSDEETRACFIPEKGNVLIDADYSSQEQIVLANFSKEENLLNFYRKGFSDMEACPSI